MVHKYWILLIIGLFCSFRSGITESVCEENKVVAFFALQDEATYNSGTKSPELQFGDECLCSLKKSFHNNKNVCLWVLNCLDICVPNAVRCFCSPNYDYQKEVKNSGITAESFMEKCQPKCICKKGYGWDADNGMCITTGLDKMFRGRFDFGIG